MNKLAIVISTYYRPDDKTKEYLYRCLESIVNQTYTNYKIFLIGDKYEKPDEVIDIINNLSITQIHFENLPEAKERDKYSGNILWSYGDEFGARPVGLKSNEFVIKNNKNGE
jgi:glycosyltransferase involved in cell wall biosynthesis